ncbi:MAG: hypothetical protein AAGN35_15185 [Bacteroidota bacterium]
MISANSSNLAYIIDYLKALPPKEIDNLQQYLNLVYQLPTAKPKQLLDLLVRGIDYRTEVEITHSVREYFRPSEISNLTTRLINILHEMMLLDAFMWPEADGIPEIERTQVNVRKRILQVQILTRKSKSEKVGIYLDIIEKRALKHELFAELVEILRIKQEYWRGRKSRSYMREISQSIELYARLDKVLMRAERAMIEGMSIWEPPSSASLHALILDLEALALPSLSRRVQLACRILNFQARSASQEAPALWKDIVASRDVLSATASSRMLAFLACTLLNEGRIAEVPEILEIALVTVPEKAVDRLLIMEMQLLLALRQSKRERAEEHMATLRGALEGWTSSEINDRIDLYQIAVDFQRGNLREASARYLECKVSRRESPGWGVGRRILEIMIAVDRHDLVTADIRHQCLIKHYYSKKLKTKLSPRWMQILAVLKALNKQAYNVEAAVADAASELEQLSHSTYRVRDGEFFGFDQWLDRLQKQA